jgi:hypothetical protein
MRLQSNEGRSHLPCRSSSRNAAIVTLLILLKQALHDASDICVCDCHRVFLVQPFPDAVYLDSDIGDQRRTNYERCDGEEGIDRGWVAAKKAFGQGVNTGLGEIDEAGDTDNCTIDAAECREAEDLGSVVRHGGVVERAQEDEEYNVDVAGPESRNGTDDTDRGDEKDDDKQNAGSADIIEQCAKERGAEYTSKG